jgi:UMP-CMP kinase
MHTENGAMILNLIKDGKIVPSEVTVKLIQKELESSDNRKFLIDGFPRTEENRVAFERIIRADPDVVLFFDCPEEEMVKRVLNRNQGRIDDNITTMKKRLKIFNALNRPVIDYYKNKGKLYTINAVGTVDDIFQHVLPIFNSFEVYIISLSLSLYYRSLHILSRTRFVLTPAIFFCVQQLKESSHVNPQSHLGSSLVENSS